MNQELAIINSLPQGQAGINEFSDSIIQDVKEGRLNPLQIHATLKALEKATDRILKEIKDNTMRERALYPEPSLSLYGAEFSKLQAIQTSYIFDNCGDTKLIELQENFDNAKKALDARKDFLKTVPVDGQPIVNEHGEAEVIYPPQKKVTDGLKVSFK